MSSVEVRIKLGSLANARLNLTQELVTAADLIGQEIRGNINRGLDANDAPLAPNKPETIRRKKSSKPLVAEYKRFVTPSYYIKKVMGMNFVRLQFSNQLHPKSNLMIGEIGYIHNYGLGRQPVREFWGVTETARKRVTAFIADKIFRLLK